MDSSKALTSNWDRGYTCNIEVPQKCAWAVDELYTMQRSIIPGVDNKSVSQTMNEVGISQNWGCPGTVDIYIYICIFVQRKREGLEGLCDPCYRVYRVVERRGVSL